MVQAFEKKKTWNTKNINISFDKAFLYKLFLPAVYADPGKQSEVLWVY